MLARVLLILLTPTPVLGQVLDDLRITPYVDVSRERLRIHEGDATIGPVTESGWTVTVGARSTRHLGAELWLSSSGATAGLAPSLRTVGLWGTVRPTQSPWHGFDGFVGVGVAGTRVSDWPDFSRCRIEVGCFAEGGGSFQNGTGLAATIGVGLSWEARPIRARVDYRTVLSSEVSGQAIPRLALGVGIVLPTFG